MQTATAPMRALILDGDGCTLVMGKKHLEILEASGLDSLVELAPHTWRAFEFNLGHMVAEVRTSMYRGEGGGCVVCTYYVSPYHVGKREFRYLF